jgi:hypothetical protein
MSQKDRITPDGMSKEHTLKRDVSKLRFGTLSWHLPYAKALLEHDPVKLDVLIKESEKAILERFLEDCTLEIDEILDLQDAVEVFAQLRQI